MSEPLLLQLRGITKRFRGVTALNNVDFTLRGGEIHALLGENGAGKSTLIKVLTGVHQPDAGTITLRGDVIAPAAPKDAERAGISTVYQEVNLIPALTVAENIMLGRQPGRFGFVNWKEMRREARAALGRLAIECDVDAELGSLSVAMQQMVAIARALDLQSHLLVLDEPTASLDEKEVADLFRIMRQLRKNGLGVVFVTHFLDQVYAMSDRITVLRNGQLVGEYLTKELPRLSLVSKMLGREVQDEAGRPAGAAAETGGTTTAPVMLETRGLGRTGAIQPVNFTLHKGEVTGLAGLLGSGRTETARLLFGLDRADCGEILLHGQPASITSPRDAVQLGIAFCSEDRKTEGILPNLSVRENLIVALQAKRGAWRTLSRAEQEKLCTHYIAALRIKTADAETPIKNLSGGNQQKVLLARWLATQPELILLDEPTRGIDVGAKAEVHHIMNELTSQGMAIIMISSDMPEIMAMSDRVLVMREGRQMGIFTREEATQEKILTAAMGQSQ